MTSIQDTLRDLSTVQVFLEELYADTNSKRTKFDIYGYVARTTGYISRRLTAKHDDSADFIRAISWLFALSSKMGLSLQDQFLRRFPGICPHCITIPCACYRTGKQPMDGAPAFKVREHLQTSYFSIRERSINLDDVTKRVSDIYPQNGIIWYASGPHRHIRKMFEELAEVHEAMTDFSQGEVGLSAVGGEIADLFAWVIGAWPLLHAETSIANIFVDYYLDGCPVCSSSPCHCGLSDSRPVGIVNLSTIRHVRDEIGEIQNTLEVAGVDTKSILASLNAALEDGDQMIAVLALAQVAMQVGRVIGKMQDKTVKARLIRLVLKAEQGALYTYGNERYGN